MLILSTWPPAGEEPDRHGFLILQPQWLIVFAKNWLRLILLGAAFVAWSAPLARGQADTAPPPETKAPALILMDDKSSQTERDEAARRLIQAKDWDNLLQAIRSPRIDAQLAVARALAKSSESDPRFIDDLARCLPANPQLAEAAAFALANYKDNPQAVQWLKDVATRANLRIPERSAAIRALGTLNDKQTAQFLVDDLLKRDSSPMINDAAADALAEMTGLAQYGNDVSQWNAWWERQRDKSPEQFRNERRAERETVFRQIIQQQAEMEKAIFDLVSDSHRAIPDEPAREAFILRRLRAAEPAVRGAGAQLVTVKKENNETITPAIVEQLRSMIGDSSPEVRRRVANAVRAINDPGSVPALLAQLKAEQIPNVKAALITALAPTKDVSAVPQLLKLLEQATGGGTETFQVAEAAAKALHDLGAEIAKDPGLTKRAGDVLEQAILRTQGAARPLRGVTRLRERLVEAMIPLRDGRYKQVMLLLKLLPEKEENSTPVRISAIRALAAIDHGATRGDIASNLVRSLHDSVKGVRLAAAEAMGIVGTSAQADELARATEPANEPDAPVREAAWNSFSSLLEQFDTRALFARVGNFADPDKKLTIYVVLNKKLIAQMTDDKLIDQRKTIAQELALVQGAIGGICLKQLARPDEAVAYLNGALQYWDDKPSAKVTAVEIQEQLIQAYLRAKRFKDAVQFGNARIKNDPQNQESMGREVSREVNRLVDAKQVPLALELIEESKKLEIVGRYRDELLRQEKDLRTRPQNYLRDLWPEWWIRSYATTPISPTTPLT